MQERYISLQEAGEKLGVVRGTLRYYLKELEIERKKFPLDKRAYIKLEDFERIVQLRQEAIERKQQTDKRQALNVVAPVFSLKQKPWIAGEDKRD